MPRAAERYENEDTSEDIGAVAPGGHGGSSVKQGLAGQSMRAAERGRDEFQGNGASAELDPGRTQEGGRHYGRPAIHEPGPDGGPPGAAPDGDFINPVDSVENLLEEEAPDGAPPPTRTLGQHLRPSAGLPSRARPTR